MDCKPIPDSNATVDNEKRTSAKHPFSKENHRLSAENIAEMR